MKAVLMIVTAALMWNGIPAMAVNVKMRGTIAVPVLMKMHTIMPEPPQYMHTEPDQHDPDRCFQRTGNVLRDHAAEKNRSAREDKQGDGVAEAPGQAVPHNIANARTPRSDAGHCCDMIGLERMLHPEQKTET